MQSITCLNFRSFFKIITCAVMICLYAYSSRPEINDCKTENSNSMETHAFLLLPLYSFLASDKTLKQKISGDSD